MPTQMTRIATAEDTPGILRSLRNNPGAHAWAIQDLKMWPERSKFHYIPGTLNNEFPDYLLVTGHPGAQKPRTIVLSGTHQTAKPLIEHFPETEWLMRETPATLRPLIEDRFPEAKIFLEKRMEVSRSTFVSAVTSEAIRRLTPEDAPALTEFKGAPPQAASNFLPWIQGSQLFAAWSGEKIASIASTFVTIPEVWELIGIETKPEYRGKGFGAQVTSALTAFALENAPVVSLTVLKNNDPALKLYAKLGYYDCEDRIWVDNGTNSSPEMH